MYEATTKEEPEDRLASHREKLKFSVDPAQRYLAASLVYVFYVNKHSAYEIKNLSVYWFVQLVSLLPALKHIFRFQQLDELQASFVSEIS